MQNDQKTMRPRQGGPTARFDVPSKAITTRPARSFSESAQRNHARYLALARGAAQAGDPVGAKTITSTPNTI